MIFSIFLLISIAHSGDSLGSRFSWTPSDTQKREISRAIQALQKTSTGKGIFKELGVSSLSGLEELGISFELGYIDSWATTSSLKNGKYKIVFRRSIIQAPPEALAPLLVHELTHVADRKAFDNDQRLILPSERRAFLLHMHVLAELEEERRLPSGEGLSGALMELLHYNQMLLRIYKGQPMPNSLGMTREATIARFEEMRAQMPGVDSLLLYIDMRRAIKDPIKEWDYSKPEDAPKIVRDYYDQVETEDVVFRASRPRKIAQLGEWQEPPTAKLPDDPIFEAGHPGGAKVGKVEEPARAQTADPAGRIASIFLQAAEDACRHGNTIAYARIASDKWSQADFQLREAVRNTLVKPSDDSCLYTTLQRMLDSDYFTANEVLLWARPAPSPSTPFNPCILEGNTCLRRE